MRTRGAIALGALCLLCVRLHADDSRLREAIQPLDDGVPEVAVVRLRALLGSLPNEADRNAAIAKLADALIRVGEPGDAMRELDSATGANDELRFLRAQALAGLQRWKDALPIYEQIAADAASLHRNEAIFGSGEALRALGRSDDALRPFTQLHRAPDWNVRADLRVVELLLEKGDVQGAARAVDRVPAKSPADRRQKRLLRGRTEAALGHNDKAIDLFTGILKRPEGATYAVILDALFSTADLRLKTETPENADDVVEDYIEHHANDAELPRVFAKLDEIYQREHKPSQRELSRWATDPVQPRRSLAQWYLARMNLRAGRRDIALQLFNQVRGSRVRLPALAGAYLEFAQLAMSDGRFDDAIAIAGEARALQPGRELLQRLDALEGVAKYRTANWPAAGEAFDHAAKAAPKFAADEFYNASLAWLQVHDTNRFIADTQKVTAVSADENTRGDLLLEQALSQAAHGNQQATQTLQNFTRDFPRHPRVAEAWVALAELAFHAPRPRVNDAQKFLARAAESPPNAAASERADYLRIWLADAAPDPNAPGVIALANEFLQKHETSSFAPDARMKLAEAYFHRQDFANAQTQFETVARENPNGRFAEKAQFFAAESALQSMGAQSLDRALVLLDEVVGRNGELKWAARNEQASIERRLGKLQQALTLYDEVLQSDAKPAEKREALCAKADTLYELAGDDRGKYNAALELYQQLAASDAPAHWRDQALFKAATCLEKLGDRARELDTLYHVIEAETRPDKGREYFWFYKAGFNAARILEEQSAWPAAAAIYQKLAQAGGDRSEEANARLTQLRLEHFLWEQ